MKTLRWYSPERVRERRRLDLERAATQLIKAADRRRARSPMTAPHGARADREAPGEPRKLTFADLPRLRRQGRVP